jgi:hypothetical protein
MSDVTRLLDGAEQTLDLNQTVRARDHPETLNYTSNLGEAYLSAGRYEDVLRVLEPSFKLCQTRLGLEHPITNATVRTLVKSYKALGRDAEAEKLLRLSKQ